MTISVHGISRRGMAAGAVISALLPVGCSAGDARIA